MKVDQYERDKMIDGATMAVDMLVDDRLCTVMVVGVYADGRGFKIWQGGDERVASDVCAALWKALPLPIEHQPLVVPHEDDDGA